MSISRAEKLRGSNNLLVRFMRFLGPWGLFFRGFLKHPVMVGSIIPSSPTLIRAMLKPVDWQNVKLFVEYGPGVGTFCRPVLERMRPDAMLIAIDTNEEFVDYLNADIADRSEEHTSELQSLMRISYAVFCLKKKKKSQHNTSKLCTQK